MPGKISNISKQSAVRAVTLAKQIRAHRKALGVSVTTAAEAAGMSRITWYRIEKGTTSVTWGAYLNALDVLGLDSDIIQKNTHDHDSTAVTTTTDVIPVKIPFSDYPQLKQLAWQIHGVDTLSPREALTIYENNWRHIDKESLEPRERTLIAALQQVFGGEAHDA